MTHPFQKFDEKKLFLLTPFYRKFPSVEIRAGLRVQKDSLLHLFFDLQVSPRLNFDPWQEFVSQGSFSKPKEWKGSFRKDELWKSVCLEGFFQFGSGQATKYFEFNFSPRGFWNFYSFQNYREGMSPVSELHGVQGFVHSTNEHRREVSLLLDLSGLPLKEFSGRASLTAVFGGEGEWDYWALLHPQSKPDFHDFQGFTISF